MTAGGWTPNPANGGNSTYFLPSYEINAGTSPLTYSGTNNASYVWAAAVIVAYKPAVAGVNLTPPVGSLGAVSVASIMQIETQPPMVVPSAGVV